MIFETIYFISIDTKVFFSCIILYH